MKENRDRTVCITAEMLYHAQEQIIYRRDTHIDILIDKLKEPRIKHVIGPICPTATMQWKALCHLMTYNMQKTWGLSSGKEGSTSA